MTDNDNEVIPDDLVRAQPGVYLAESAPAMVWLNIKEILTADGREYDDSIAGTVATQLIAAYAADDIHAVVIHDD